MSLTASRRDFAKIYLISLGLFAQAALALEDQKTGAGKTANDDKKSASDGAVYEAGGEVKPPKLVHYVEPAFSSSSKEAFVDGIVTISTVVHVDGVPSELHIVKGLNADEDRTAMDAVKQWRFEPGTKNGQAVNVRVTVEVSFHLL